jgi:hypothetical protein
MQIVNPKYFGEWGLYKGRVAIAKDDWNKEKKIFERIIYVFKDVSPKRIKNPEKIVKCSFHKVKYLTNQQLAKEYGFDELKAVVFNKKGYLFLPLE